MIQKVVTFSDNINSMHLNAAGVWFGHQGGLSFFNPRTTESAKWTTADGLPAHPVLHVNSCEGRLAIATPNGVAWSDDYAAFLRDSLAQEKSPKWSRGLMNARGTGAYINGVSFVDKKIYATTGGGRIYLEAAGGFQLLELPLPQARLLRVAQLAVSPSSRRLLIVTNNSGVLLLATGDDEEPSLYQWGEEEGLASRYVTTMVTTDEFVIVGVHGCMHVARIADLVNNPSEVSRWGRIVMNDLTGPSEHTRIHTLCIHGDHLYAGSSAGMYLLSLADLDRACQERAEAYRVEEKPVRHLCSDGDTLWAVQQGAFGRFLEGSRGTASSSSTNRLDRNDGEDEQADKKIMRPRIVSFGRRWRFVPEPRWKGFSTEPECRHVLSIASTPEGLVIGGDAGRVVTHVGERWVTEVVSRTRRAPDVHSLVRDPDGGALWTATRYGLFQRDSRGRWQRDMSFPGRTVHQLTVWGGNMLAVGSAGLHAFAQGAWREVPLGEYACPLFAAASGEAGLILAGKPGAGFHLWRPDDSIPTSCSLPVGRANCMAWGSNGDLWLGTDRGIARWDGDDLVVFAWKREREDHVSSLLVQGDTLYVGSQAGIWISSTALEPGSGDELESQGKRFGLLDGMPNMQATCMVEHQGCVWVGTQGGLVQFESNR